MWRKWLTHRLRTVRTLRAVRALEHPWRRTSLSAAVLSVLVVGCPRLDMYDQPRYETQEASGLFADGGASQHAPEGTIARGALHEDRVLFTGTIDDSTFTSELPLALSRQMLERGCERYGIFCAVCHDAAGTGRGMVVRRGFKQPASLHEARLQNESVGYFFDVITNGFATMPGYAAQIDAYDRWAIVAYIRALQLSQSVDLNTLAPETRRDIEAALSNAAASHQSQSQREAHD